jgi:DNA repair protein RadA/Sms
VSSKTSGRVQTRYVCQACGESFLRWEGQCRSCQAWNTLVETAVRTEPRVSRVGVGPGIGGLTPTTRLDAIGVAAHERLPIGIPELDRVLGGGLVPGSVVLVGGEPGIGKSTLLLQAAAGVAAAVGPERVVYATGEESASQVRLRADRLGLLAGPAGGIRIAAESSIDRIAGLAIDEPTAGAPRRRLDPDRDRR